MIQKILKFALCAALLVAVLAVAAFFTLKKMYPPEKLKQMTQTWVAQHWNREVRFSEVSFAWIGFTLKDVALSENSSFDQGTFVEAKKLTAHVAVKPLLQKRIEISTIEADGLQINLIAKKDKTYNFSSLIPEQPSTENTEAPQTDDKSTNENNFVITAQEIKLSNCDVTYIDESTGLHTALNEVSIQTKNLDFVKPFDTVLSFITTVSGNGQPDLSVPVTVHFITELANLDISKATISLTQATLHYKNILLTLLGKISSLERPTLDLTGNITGITNATFADFAPQLPDFALPSIGLSLQATADLEQQTAQISQAKMTVQDSIFTAQGSVGWGGDTPTYKLTGSLTAILNQLVQMTHSLDDFSPAGMLTATFAATEKNEFTDVNGTIYLKDISVRYDPFTLTKLNGKILLTSLEHIAAPTLTGQLNGENFSGSFTYQALKQVINIILNVNLDQLKLAKLPSTGSSQVENSATGTTSTNSGTTSPSLPINLRAKVEIGKITIPYFQSNGLNLQANLTNLTNTMDQANGTVHFALQPGKITNLDDFVEDSKIAKILLLPLTVIKHVAGFLKLDIFSAPDDNGAYMAFTEGTGDYTFANGIMNIDKTVFNSTLTNLSATGTANFKTEALNMRATTTLLTQAAPVSFKITGTLSDPKGKLDVVNTVTSVVGGILNGTAAKSASNEGTQPTQETLKDTVTTAKDLVKGIGGLFKKK